MTQTAPLALALEADGVVRHLGLAAGQGRAQHLEQLPLVDRAAAELEVDEDVLRDRRGGREGVEELGVGVDRGRERGDVGDAARSSEVAQRLDAAGGRAGADRDELARLRADLADALRVVAVVTDPSTSETS
jgi:hypothetical protein